MQWNVLLLRPCSGSWKTFSRCRTRSTRTPPPTDLRLGTTPSLCIISSLLYCRQYTTVSIIRTYCDIRQLIINCNVESWVILGALSKVVQCPFERWMTPFLLSPPFENEMKAIATIWFQLFLTMTVCFVYCNLKGSYWYLPTHGEYFQPQRALIKHWIQNGWLQKRKTTEDNNFHYFTQYLTL